MKTNSTPRDYQAWRTKEPDRADDAANLFGYYLIKHCRDEAIATLTIDALPQIRAAVENAVDIALHNVCDLLEGFWPLDAGLNRRVSLVLGVQVRDENNEAIETVEISPSKLDLPIGYWRWAEHREFR